jgi:hypothetical protein
MTTFCPSPKIAGSYVIDEGSTIELDATGSDDPDGALVTYEWDINADGEFEIITDNVTASCLYPDDYQGPVYLQVTDNQGLSNTTMAGVSVNNVAPVVEIGPFSPAAAGSEFQGTGSFIDPGLDNWTATVDYGDVSGQQPLTLGAKTFTLSHTYTQKGEYTVTVEITDDDGGTGRSAATIRVLNNASMQLASSKNPSQFGDNVTFTATIAPDSATGTVQFYLDGDNVGSPVVLSGGSAASDPVSGIAVGDHTIAAIYSGDDDFAPGIYFFNQKVNAAGGGVFFGGGGVGASSATLTLKGFQQTATLALGNDGAIQGTTQLTTVDGKIKLSIADKTKMLNGSGNPLAELSVDPPALSYSAPSGCLIITAYSFGLDGAQFDPALTLTMSYDPASLPLIVAEKDLYIGSHNGTGWETMKSDVDIKNHTVSVAVSHFSTYALLGKIVEPNAPSLTPTPEPKPTPTHAPSPVQTPESTPSITLTASPTPTPPPTSALAQETPIPSVSVSTTANSEQPTGNFPTIPMILGVIGVLVILVLIMIFLRVRKSKP